MVLAVAAGLLAALVLLHRYWLRQLTHLTGDAQWVWVTDALERVYPVAGLFTAPLRLAAPPARALLKVCGDREYVVYVNGTPAAAGWSRPGFRLEIFEVGHLLRQGDNLIACEVRSPTPAGGLLLALDVAGVGRNVLVSGPGMGRRSVFALDQVHAGERPVPVVWGAPPRFPWGYPTPLVRARTLDGVVVEEPIRITAEEAEDLPGGGRRFTLGEKVFGYLWLHFETDGAAFVAAGQADPEVSLTDLRWSAQPVVRLPGQRQWLDPEPRLMDSVAVFGAAVPVAVELWPVAEEFRPGAPGVVSGTYGPVPRTRWTTRNPPE